MAYTHADGRIITALSTPFRVKCVAASEAGDLVGCPTAATGGVTLSYHTTTATLLSTRAAWAVMLEKTAAAAWGWCALAVEITDPCTIAAEGVVTRGSLVADTSEIMEPLYLSGTAGQAESTAPTASATALVKQYVGYVVDIDRVILAPTMQILAAALA